MEYIKLLRTTSNSFWLMCFFSLNIAFSSIDALLHSFEIWSSNGNRLSVVVPKRITEFSDLISFLLIWSFSGITFFIDFCRSTNWNLSGFTIMLLFLNQCTANTDSSLMFQAMCLFFWMQLKLYCHLQNYKYQNSLIPLPLVIKEHIKEDRTEDRPLEYHRDQNLKRA